jgi:hypothetical protein
MRTLLGLCAAACTLGCGPPFASTGGELGRGVFIYHCGGWSDAGCDDGFPSELAVGGSFHLSYEAELDLFGSGPGPLSVSPASPGLVGSDGMSPARSGTLAYFAVDSSGAMFDLIHLDAVDVQGVDVRVGGESVDEITIPFGQHATVQVLADTDSGTVAGALPATWSTSDEVVAWVSEGEPTLLDVYGANLGRTELAIELGNVRRRIPIVVADGPVDPSTSESSGPATRDDATTDESSTSDGGTDENSTDESGTDESGTSESGTSEGGAT